MMGGRAALWGLVVVLACAMPPLTEGFLRPLGLPGPGPGAARGRAARPGVCRLMGLGAGVDPGKVRGGYVIVPQGEANAEDKKVKPAGWTLWDQRTKGVTVVIGNSKQRRMSARHGKHFGPLAVPDLAKLQHKLKELEEEKKKAHDEVEAAEREHLSDYVIKPLKKKKLAIKDKINVLQTTIDSYNPTDYQPKMLGEGAYGAILLGRDLESGSEVAIKVEPIDPKIDSAIKYEYDVYSKLSGVAGFPVVKYFGQQRVMNKECRVMVMELLGPSIEDLWWEVTGGGRGFEPATAYGIAHEMVGLLQSLHEKGFVHRDVKPDNFLMHSQDGTGNLCLIDLGISNSFLDDGGNHIKFEKGKDFFGTCRYASINAHQGLQQSRRDDLESLAYTTAFLLGGALPWEQDTSDVSKAGLLKLRAIETIESGDACTLEGTEEDPLCMLLNNMTGAGAECVRDFLLYTRSLAFDEEPDYDKIRGFLLKAFTADTGKDDYVPAYEWIEQRKVKANDGGGKQAPSKGAAA